MSGNTAGKKSFADRFFQLRKDEEKKVEPEIPLYQTIQHFLNKNSVPVS